VGGDNGRVVRVKMTGCEGGDGGGLVSEDGGAVIKSSCKRGVVSGQATWNWLT